MKERPILFSAPMVRAILEGRKTQTCRAATRPKDDIAEKPVKKIDAWMGMQDNGSWDKEPCPCCESLEYFRSDVVLDALSKLLWQRDYPNGGSIVKSWEDNQYHDRYIYRKEALALLKQKGSS